MWQIERIIQSIIWVCLPVKGKTAHHRVLNVTLNKRTSALLLIPHCFLHTLSLLTACYGYYLTSAVGHAFILPLICGSKSFVENLVLAWWDYTSQSAECWFTTSLGGGLESYPWFTKTAAYAHLQLKTS